MSMVNFPLILALQPAPAEKLLTATQKRYIQWFSDVFAFRGMVPNVDPMLLDSLTLYSTAPTPDELRGCVPRRL